MSVQRLTDRTVRLDTSGVSGTTVTLGAAITTTTAPAVTLASAGAVVNGTVIRCGTEQMWVTSGAVSVTWVPSPSARTSARIVAVSVFAAFFPHVGQNCSPTLA